LKQGAIFFALKGPSFNGNAFANQALDSGASYAIIDEPEFFKNERTILVNNVLETLQQLALHHRKQFHIPFIAITGSNGKTTTKELIHAVLSTQFKTYTTEGNLNNHIGIPLTILRVKKDAEMAVIEMGANHQKEIASYCLYTAPTHGLITNCGKAHLEGFGGVEGVRKGKGELFDFLRENNGLVFVNHDDEYLPLMSSGIKASIGYGSKEGAVQGSILANDPFVEVSIHHAQNSFEIKTNLVGSYNLPNILAAVAIGLHFGVPSEKIRHGIEQYAPSNSRSQLLKKGGNSIVLDAYNANPSSMKLAIENFAGMGGYNKVLFLGAMAELGDESLEEHQNILNLISKHSWQLVVLVGGDFQKLEHPYIRFSNSDEAANWLTDHPLEGSHILVKGSRSSKMERILDAIK
jgi:UDP-N-acetylmuramoyl-tripeptide--D-alanyl-D-alanine ligase